MVAISKLPIKKGDKQIPSRLSPRDLKLINYLYENYAEDITIDQLSKIFDSNPKDINSMLNYFVEDNFSNFLNQLRVNKACDLLIKTDLSIIDIAYQVGFNSSKTLTRNFKKILQLSPSEFRKLNPKEQVRY
ncbi:helix-turn-helix domain-containing protein [Aerococcus urinae]|uniref:helix-turn-helix domain-containing protein n=1 Tax=Aerococcus urinae TaxID=1376 RepID=UPI003D7DE2C7